MLVLLIVLGAGLAWMLSYAGCVLVTGTEPRGRGPAHGLLPAGPPALVNLAVTRARLDAAAYPATILDLAAQGQLVITESGGGTLCCAPPPAAPAVSRLAPFEEQVLAEVRRRLAGPAPVPFEVLADLVAVDAPRLLHPFETAVRAAGRQHGLTRPRFSRAMESALLGGAVVFGLVAGLAVLSRSGHGLASPISVAAFGMFLPACCVWGIAGRDRLTRAGADLAAQVAAVAALGPVGAPGGVLAPLVLRQLALAVAGHVPVPLTGVRPGGQRPAAPAGGPPSAAWSSMTGEWRLVPIRPPGIPRRRNPFRLLGLAGLGVLALAYTGWLEPLGTLANPVRIAALAVVLLLAVTGLLALTGYLAQPASASFGAQVIARWEEDRGKQDTVIVYCYAVDDGQQSWCGEASETDFARLRVGDMIQVHAAPRTRRLTGLGFTRPAS